MILRRMPPLVLLYLVLPHLLVILLLTLILLLSLGGHQLFILLIRTRLLCSILSRLSTESMELGIRRTLLNWDSDVTHQLLLILSCHHVHLHLLWMPDWLYSLEVRLPMHLILSIQTVLLVVLMKHVAVCMAQVTSSSLNPLFSSPSGNPLIRH